MGKPPCFVCGNNLGWRDLGYNVAVYEKVNVPIPSGLTENDNVCNKCFIAEQDKEKQEKTAEFKTRYDEIDSRSEEYKKHWDKNGVIQFKNERIAILHRMVGAQVQFIVAFDDLTKEGYRLMAQDEGKTGGGMAASLAVLIRTTISRKWNLFVNLFLFSNQSG